jgi:hypothetical protein
MFSLPRTVAKNANEPARKNLDGKLIMLLLSQGCGCASSLKINSIVILETMNNDKFSNNQPQTIIETECALQHQPIIIGTMYITNCDYHGQWLDFMVIIVPLYQTNNAAEPASPMVTPPRIISALL